MLERRKGHGGESSLSSLVVGTYDSIFDTRPPPYRVLLQTDDDSSSYVLAVALKRADIRENWEWLEENLLNSLDAIDKDDLHQYVCTKIDSLLTITGEARFDQESATHRNVALRFTKIFASEEKVVNYYACCYWNGRLPLQGHLYVTLTTASFHSYIMGTTTKR